MLRRWLIPGVMIALVLTVASCGPDSEAIDPISWPYLESTEPLTIAGKEYKAFVASTEQHRKRAINGLAIGPSQVIAMLYPKMEDPVEIKFNSVPDPIDLVFIDESAKVVQIDEVPAFSQSTFPRNYGGKHARVVLMLPRGAAAEAKITLGSQVTTSPDLVARSNDAEREFARMYFLRNEQRDDKPEPSPFVSLKVLKKVEDVAQLMKDRDELREGEGVIVPVGSQYHTFWLKGVKGKVCAAWVETAGRQGTSILSSIYEGIEAGNGRDLDEPIYYSPGKPQYLAIWRGADYFTRNKIERRSPVSVTGVDVSSFDAVDYGNIEIEFGDEHVKAQLAQTEEARAAALRKAPALEQGRASVLAWDDPEQVEVNAPAGATLWYVGADGAIANRVEATGGIVDFKATSRFVLVLPKGFAPEGEFKMPYVLRDLKPSLPAVVFYNAKQADVVTDRWPGEKDNFKARAHVELAVTATEQRRGLMFRESLKPNHGMLFIYNEEQTDMSYWMKNCRMNLSIAFISDRGTIVKIHNVMTKPAEGTPDGALEHYEAGQPARYAVEMEENWFEKNGIKEGDRIFIPPALTEKK